MRRRSRNSGCGCGCGCSLFIGIILIIAGVLGYFYFTTSKIDVKQLDDIEKRQYYVPAESMPDYVKQAFVAVEDKRFYNHDGVDYFGTMRALLVSLKNGEASQGGSTITQQLAKTYFFNSEKSVSRKIKEVFVAKKIENNYSKDEILGFYLNTIYYGDNVYNIEQAANQFFGATTDREYAALPKVTVLQSAVLASAINAPSNYNIANFQSDDALKSRTKTTLKKMYEQKYITDVQYNDALAGITN